MAAQTILLFLHSIPPTQVSWTLLDENNTPIETHLRSDLSKLTLTYGQEIIVIIPAQDILLTVAELPKLTRNRLQLAIPFAIEEQLINDISELHFAIGKYIPENRWPVAVINQHKMAELIESLNHWQIQPTQIIPITLALPLNENSWTIYCLDAICYVRTEDYAGFACESENLNLYLESKLADKTEKPATIDLYSEHEIPISLASNYPIIHHKINEKEIIESLARGINTLPFINLMQGPFRTKRKLAESKKFWLYAAYITIAWIGIGFFSNLFSLFLLSYQNSTIQSAINTIYQHNFPNTKSMAAPKSHMEEKLKTITTQASSESFLVLLANVSKAFSQVSGSRLQSIDYRDKQLTLEISANSFDDLDSLTSALQQNGLVATQQHAEIIAGRVKAALQINSGGT